MNILAAATLGSWLDTTFAGFDWSVFSFFGKIQNDILTFLATAFTSMGAVSYTVLFAILGLVLILFKKTRKLGLALVIAIALGTLLTNLLFKPMALRIRPYNTLQNVGDFLKWYTGAGMLAESDYCFPSGHTTAATEIAIVLCLCHGSHGKKRIAWIFPLIAVLVACSRVYLMVHYATDVLAGLVIGLIAGFVGYYVSRAIVRALNRSPEWRKRGLERVIWKKWHRKVKGAPVAVALIAGWIIIFLVAFLPEYHNSVHASEILRCAYHEDYQCYNEAQTKAKYPPINGEYYCKIHWKEMNQAAGSEAK